MYKIITKINPLMSAITKCIVSRRVSKNYLCLTPTNTLTPTRKKLLLPRLSELRMIKNDLFQPAANFNQILNHQIKKWLVVKNTFSRKKKLRCLSFLLPLVAFLTKLSISHLITDDASRSISNPSYFVG